MYSPVVDAVVLLVIVINLAGMAADQPWEARRPELETLELVCSVLYTAELILKVAAMEGVLPYLADPWQSLDAFIVVGGWAAEAPGIAAALTGQPPAFSLQLSALRGLRGLRALRTVRVLQGVREMLETLAATLPIVIQVLLLNLCLVACLAAAGTEAFGPALTRRCALPPAVAPGTAAEASALGLTAPAAWPPPPALTSPAVLFAQPRPQRLAVPESFCTRVGAPPGAEASLLNGSAVVVGTGGVATALLPPFPSVEAPDGGCDGLHRCVWAAASPHGGLSSFADAGSALFTTVRVSLRAPGTESVPMGATQATSWVGVLFFVALALVVSFSSVSLFVALVRATFTDIVKRREALRKSRQRLQSGGSDGDDADGGGASGPSSDRTGKIAAVSAPAPSSSARPPLDHASSTSADGPSSSATSTAAIAAAVSPDPGGGQSSGEVDVTIADAGDVSSRESRAGEPPLPQPSWGAAQADGVPGAVTEEEKAAAAAAETPERRVLGIGPRPPASVSSDGSGGGRALRGMPALAARAMRQLREAEARKATAALTRRPSMPGRLPSSGSSASSASSYGSASEAGSAEDDDDGGVMPAPPRAPDAWVRPCDATCLCIPRTSLPSRAARWLVTRPLFDRSVLLLIVANTVVLGIEHAGMDRGLAAALSAVELALTVAFAAEMALKVVGLGGLYHYAVAPGTAWNRFDAAVVLITLADLAVVLAADQSPLEPTGPFANAATGGFGPGPEADGAGGAVNLSVLRVVRVVRVLRLLRLIRGFDDLKRLVRVIGATLADVGSWLAVTAVMVVTFSLAGMQFFGGALGSGAERPRATFDSFGDAALTVLRMMTGGGTWAVVQSMMEAPAGQAGLPGAVAGPVFFFLLLVVMNYQLLNFLTVLILSRFALTGTERRRKQRERNALHAATVADTAAAMDRLADDVIGRRRRKTQPTDGPAAASSPDAAAALPGSNRSLPPGGTGHHHHRHRSGGRQYLHPCSGPAACLDRADGRDWALCLLPPRALPRRVARRVARSHAFEGVVLAAIILSSIALAAESPSLPPGWRSFLGLADLVFLIIFWGEFAVKVAAAGFLFGPNPYLRGEDATWNVIDFVVLVTSSVSLGSATGGIARVARLGRVMRPLRAIRRNPQMRIVTNALLRAMPSVSWTLLLTAAVFVLWAIMGVSLLAGKTHRCTDPAAAGIADCVGWFRPPAAPGNLTAPALLLPRAWVPARSSFDSFPAALVTLFEVFTLRSWAGVLTTVMDVRGYDAQPARDANPGAAVFLLAFLWVAAVYMSKLFVGVIVGFFRQYSGSALLSPEQADQRVTQAVLGASRAPAPAPAGCACRAAYRLVSPQAGGVAFECTAAGVCLAHVIAVVVLATTASGHAIAGDEAAAAAAASASLAVHWAATAAYATELCLRVAARGGPRGLLWATSTAEVVSESSLLALHVIIPLLAGSPSGIGPVRLLFVLARLVLRRRLALALGLGSVRRILMVIAEALPALANVTALVALFLFTWAVLGTQLFASVRFGPALRPGLSFASFPDSAWTLFLTVLGSDWTRLMDDVAVEPPRCTAGDDCGSRPFALVYFFAWHVVFGSVFSNLYTAAILDQYATVGLRTGKEQSLEEGGKVSDDPTSVALFAKAWARADPQGTGRIPASRLGILLRCLWAVGHPFMRDLHLSGMTRSFLLAVILLRADPPKQVAAYVLSGADGAASEPRVRFSQALQALQQLTADPERLEPYEDELRGAVTRLALVIAAGRAVRVGLHATRQRAIARKLTAAANAMP